MHSSGMHTVRSSGRRGGGVYPSMHWAGVCVSQHALGNGVSAKGAVCPNACWYTHLPVNRITDWCKNITFPKFRLRTVIIFPSGFNLVWRDFKNLLKTITLSLNVKLIQGITCGCNTLLATLDTTGNTRMLMFSFECYTCFTVLWCTADTILRIPLIAIPASHY